MASFDRYKNNCARIDWEAMMSGGISLYYDTNILEKTIIWLEKYNYQINIIDFNEIDTIEKFHEIIKFRCDFPEYYGANMSALSDCLLHDLQIPYESGLAFVFKGFDLFYRKDKFMAHELLEKMSMSSKSRILTGERLITLVQSYDPCFEPDLIGARRISWNRHELIEDLRKKDIK